MPVSNSGLNVEIGDLWLVKAGNHWPMGEQPKKTLLILDCLMIGHTHETPMWKCWLLEAGGITYQYFDDKAPIYVCLGKLSLET